MKGLLIILFFAAVLLNVNCSNSTEVNPEAGGFLKGTLKDTLGNPLSDVNVVLVYKFYEYPLQFKAEDPIIHEFFPNSVLSDTTMLFQNRPNPFFGNTFFEFTLGKVSNVSAGIYDLNNKSILPDYRSEDSLSAGSHVWDINLSNLPSGAYKLVMNIDEMGDSAYSLEKDFIMTMPYPNPYSIANSIPNTVSSEGAFSLNYKDLPLGRKYKWTSQYEPYDRGEIQVNDTLTVAFYKYGYDLIIQDVEIDPRFSKELNVVMKSW